MSNVVTTNGHDEPGGSGGGVRPPRLPRWTRQEILVLIQGKKMAETRGRGRSRLQHMGSAGTPLVGVGAPVEPKWATVSSYCRRHGVNRGPVQCRKRWSNLAGDFKKVKEWELRRAEAGGDSFWSMRNDLRRERRLPGFFDREVYDILDGAVEVGGDSGPKEAAAMPAAAAQEDDDEEDDTAAAFDSGRAVGDDGLFSDLEADDEAEEEERPAPAPATAVAATPISERKSDSHDPSSSDQAIPSIAAAPTAPALAAVEKLPAENPMEKPAETNKRKRSEDDMEDEPTEPSSLEHRLIDILERNSRMVSTQLEAHNANSRLDREQRRELTNTVVQVLGKLADALGRIADKL